MSAILENDIQVTIFAGDADMVCSWPGDLEVANAVPWPGQESFEETELLPYTVRGKSKGMYKSFDNLAFVRVYDAGHAVGRSGESFIPPFGIFDLFG